MIDYDPRDSEALYNRSTDALFDKVNFLFNKPVSSSDLNEAQDLIARKILSRVMFQLGDNEMMVDFDWVQTSKTSSNVSIKLNPIKIIISADRSHVISDVIDSEQVIIRIPPYPSSPTVNGKYYLYSFYRQKTIKYSDYVYRKGIRNNSKQGSIIEDNSTANNILDPNLNREVTTRNAVELTFLASQTVLNHANNPLLTGADKDIDNVEWSDPCLVATIYLDGAYNVKVRKETPIDSVLRTYPDYNTKVARKVDIPGINSFQSLHNIPIFIESSFDQTMNNNNDANERDNSDAYDNYETKVTLQVNDLAAKEIIVYDKSPTNYTNYLPAKWVRPHQVYVVAYDSDLDKFRLIAPTVKLSMPVGPKTSYDSAEAKIWRPANTLDEMLAKLWAWISNTETDMLYRFSQIPLDYVHQYRTYTDGNTNDNEVNLTQNYMYDITNGSSIGLPSNSWHIIHMRGTQTAGTDAQLAISTNVAKQLMYYRTAVSSAWRPWEKVITDALWPELKFYNVGPTTPGVEDRRFLWIDTNSGRGVLKYWGGAAWIAISSIWTSQGDGAGTIVID